MLCGREAADCSLFYQIIGKDVSGSQFNQQQGTFPGRMQRQRRHPPSRLAHAASRPFPARIPETKGETHLPRDGPVTRPGHRGDAATPPPVPPRCRDSVQRHPRHPGSAWPTVQFHRRQRDQDGVHHRQPEGHRTAGHLGASGALSLLTPSAVPDQTGTQRTAGVVGICRFAVDLGQLHDRGQLPRHHAGPSVVPRGPMLV